MLKKKGGVGANGKVKQILLLCWFEAPVLLAKTTLKATSKETEDTGLWTLGSQACCTISCDVCFESLEMRIRSVQERDAVITGFQSCGSQTCLCVRLPGTPKKHSTSSRGLGTYIEPTAIRMATSKKPQKMTRVCEDVEPLEPLCAVGGNATWYGCYGKQ